MMPRNANRRQTRASFFGVKIAEGESERDAEGDDRGRVTQVYDRCEGPDRWREAIAEPVCMRHELKIVELMDIRVCSGGFCRG